MRALVFVTIVLLLLCVGGCMGNQPGEDIEPTIAPDIAQGSRLYVEHCVECHATTPGLAIVGPSLAGIMDTAVTRVPEMSAEAYVRQSILEPGAYVVPGFNDGMPEGLVTGAEADLLIAYLSSLP